MDNGFNQFNSQTPDGNKNGLKINFNPLSIAVIAASIVVLIGCYLPWAELSSFGMSETAHVGGSKDFIFFIVLVILACVGSLLSKSVLTVCAGIALTFISWREIQNCKDEYDGLFGIELNTKVGFYITIIASLAILAIGIFSLIKENKR